jgi:hypothetical protein
MNIRHQPLFECRYKSDGRIYTCRVRATSAEDAQEKLQKLDWAPGCGPVGAPFRIFEGKVMAEPAELAATTVEAAFARTVKWVGAALDMIAEPFHPHRRPRHFHGHGRIHG